MAHTEQETSTVSAEPGTTKLSIENFFTASEGRSTCSRSKSDPTTSADYYSPRIRRLKERMKRAGIQNKVDGEIDASKDHWSELLAVTASTELDTQEDALSEANKELFKSLQKEPYGSFFGMMEGFDTLGEKLAEGGQAEIFDIRARFTAGNAVFFSFNSVLKVFKKGTALEHLVKQIPQGLLQRHVGLPTSESSPHEWERHRCNVARVVLLEDGRFAFRMERYYNDLRKFIDHVKAMDDRNDGPPLHEDVAILCMLQVALGIRGLHEENIIHRDLKAANVLICKPKYGGHRAFDKLKWYKPFLCCVADYECSIGVVGTGFWRAPEILEGLKNFALKEELFTKKSDVYSFGMVCYEILSGLIPFELEGTRRTDYDFVLSGNRPHLPRDLKPWIKEMVTRCWHQEPSRRPTIAEVVGIIETMEPSSRDRLHDLMVLWNPT